MDPLERYVTHGAGDDPETSVTPKPAARYTVRETNAGEWVVSNNRTGDAKSVHPDERSAVRAAASLERKRLANLRRFSDLYRET